MGKSAKTQLMAAWYSHVGEMACWGCLGHPVELAHFKALVSQKTGEPLNRRTGINEWAVIPLCPECHRLGKQSIHRVGETAFFLHIRMTTWEAIQAWASMFGAFMAENAVLDPRKR